MRQRFLHYLDPFAGDDAGTGGDAGAAGAGGDAGAAADAGGSLLGDALGGDAGGEPVIPEKFLVKGQDGNPDFKASFGKMAPSYSELEKRLGSIGMPPKTAAEYKVEKFLPDGFEAKQEIMGPLLEKMHEAGLTNKQVQAVLNVYGEHLGTGLAAEKQAYETGKAQLKEAWGDAYQQNLTHVKAAISAYGTPEERQALTSNPKYVNDPVLLQFLAKVGADLGEDRIPNEFSGSAGEDIQALRTSEAYLNKRHPDHAATVAKVNAAYQRGYKAK